MCLLVNLSLIYKVASVEGILCFFFSNFSEARIFHHLTQERLVFFFLELSPGSSLPHSFGHHCEDLGIALVELYWNAANVFHDDGEPTFIERVLLFQVEDSALSHPSR